MKFVLVLRAELSRELSMVCFDRSGQQFINLGGWPSFYVQAATEAVILAIAVLTTLMNKLSTVLKTRT